jgi:hypothetical protein
MDCPNGNPQQQQVRRFEGARTDEQHKKIPSRANTEPLEGKKRVFCFWIGQTQTFFCSSKLLHIFLLNIPCC